jgi:uncharacterized protein (TIGR02217 family)
MFLEERFPECIRYGSSKDRSYSVDVVTDAADNAYPIFRHPYVISRFDSDFSRKSFSDMSDMISLFDRCGGMFGGFRVKDITDYTTNAWTAAPTFSDQLCTTISAASGTYQLIRWYGTEGGSTAARRRIRKPVSGTVVVGIRDAAAAGHQITAFTVDTTTGIITLSANKTDTVVDITQAASAVVDIGTNTIAIGDSVHFSGVVGMTEINGKRGLVTAKPDSTHITVNIDSTAFTAYASGGTINTRPQTGETVRAGCEFDIPCRFETDLSGITHENYNIMGVTVQLIEWLNPS